MLPASESIAFFTCRDHDTAHSLLFQNKKHDAAAAASSTLATGSLMPTAAAAAVLILIHILIPILILIMYYQKYVRIRSHHSHFHHIFLNYYLMECCLLRSISYSWIEKTGYATATLRNPFM